MKRKLFLNFLLVGLLAAFLCCACLVAVMAGQSERQTFRQLAEEAVLAQQGYANAGDTWLASLETDLRLTHIAADGKVLCVYPKRLTKLTVRRKLDALEVSLLAADGHPAPGRQVVEVEVRDPSGALHDETGRYVMEGGRLSVPLRFAGDDPKGSLFKRWKVHARELTSGLTVTEGFSR